MSLPAGGRLDIPPLASERALYAVDGAYRLQDRWMEPYMMAVLPAGDTVRVEAETPARGMLIGGEPLDGPRLILWDFLSSRRGRVTAAAFPWSAPHTTRLERQ